MDKSNKENRELQKSKSRELSPYDVDDGVAGWEDREEGQEEGGRQSPLEGRTVIKFTNDCRWVEKGGGEIAPDREFLFEKVKRVLTHWSLDNKPTKETRVLGPRELWPNVEKLNATAPKSEWRADPNNRGKKLPPYQKQRLLFVRDIKTAVKYVNPSATDGGHYASSDLIDDITYMRRRSGRFVSPVIRLGKRFMPTRYGGRDAPQFLCVRWVGGDEGLEIGADDRRPLPASADLSTSMLRDESAEEKESQRHVTKKGVQRITPTRKAPRVYGDDDETPFEDDPNI